MTKIIQNKNDSKNSMLQHVHVVDNNCCAVFPTLRFLYLSCVSDSANNRR